MPLAGGGLCDDRGVRSAALKRCIDVVVAVVALVVLAVPMGLIALAILVTSGRPVLFRHVRPGRHEVPFELLKFRTMSVADHDRPEEDAARITRLGALLRAASLDELPTLLNVVRGDLSLVGPRPLLVRYLDRYTPEQRRRHEVRPGITGLAQVSGRNALGWEERLALDVAYVDGWTIGGDLRILVRTLASVLRREGISEPGHPTRSEFRGAGGDGAT